ncbi:MAG: CapA family protein [Candidatus Vogelbacteria bacterium]|nr:CapA family protein [Candidatus Vogelbacteria bacterium]
MKYFFYTALAGLFGILLVYAGDLGIKLVYHDIFDNLGEVSYQAAAVGTTLTSDVKSATGGPTSDVVTLTFVGDLMLDRGVRNSVVKNGGGDYSWLFAKLDNFPGDAILFGNLEGPLSDVGVDRQNLYSFRMSPAALPAIKNAGFQVLSVANNHVGDWGRAAFTDTISRLAAAGLAAGGGGQNRAEAVAPKIITASSGERVGFLAFSDVGPNELAATETEAGIILASDPVLPQIISQAANVVDILVISFHWGDEYQTRSNARQQTLAHLAIDNGAKLVIGHHPHVIQEPEYYKEGVIAYSLGNFIFDQYFSQATMTGLVLTIEFQDRKISAARRQKVTLDSDFRPSVTDLDESDG